MEVLINDQPYQVSEEGKMQEALDCLQLSDTQGIALAVNNEVVPKTQWESYRLRPGDKIILIRATQGG